ncbi:Pectate lyase [Mariniradius saccharolyticus AK6]|uniref:Pectate lyase n=1 Tax=Mariniradius saccharolyticus AK6 TaxID=1239962 RepID=M7XAZ7_9BACT|nr:pectate lyase [Mariniradius saccharolyticus]EMS32074.1 Pectate lyase [Mariniradius saccharolyticus AK6]
MYNLIQLQVLLIWFSAFLGNSIQFSYRISDLDQIAFPGAEGFGKYASGGRGGLVYIVTNLNDSGPGSLRWAVEAKGPRTVVFEVSGNIELKSRLNVGDGNLTIAGQSAPGDGITIQNYPFRIIGKTNIIIRFIRFRHGDLGDEIGDAFEARSGCENLMIDHCSFSWGLDETCSIYGVSNATIQNCIVSEGINDVSRFDKNFKHAYGGIIGGMNVSFYGNLMCHFMIRMPSIAKESSILDIRNNVFYNWGFRPTNNGSKAKTNLISNYYKPGPATKALPSQQLVDQTFLWASSIEKDPITYGKFYLEGNMLEGRTEILQNQWLGVRLENSERTRRYLDLCKNKDANGNLIPFEVSEGIYLHKLTARDAFSFVLENAGANLHRDEVDLRLIHEVKTGTAKFKGSLSGLLGIIDSQADVGGWPQLNSQPPPIDTDRDGMPDYWEIEKGLNPERRDDRFYNLDPNYTNLEVYLNGLVSHLMRP